jgi:hypothetical protein
MPSREERTRLTLRLSTTSAFLVAASFCPAADLTLVSEGHPQAAVVLADQPSVATKQAGELFVTLVEQISGVKLALTAERSLSDVQLENGQLSASLAGSQPTAFVLLGESGLTKRLGVTSEGLGAGGILLRTCPNALILLGADDKTPADPYGTRYATTTFLEDVLGVRFLWPGELGLVVPPRQTIRVPPLDHRFTPRIVQRRIRSGQYSDRVQAGLDYLGLSKAEFDRQQAAAQTGQWFDWQRLGGSLGLVAGHAFGYTWEKYHAEHPEWFALQPNGSRDLSRLSPERARLCKSNLALIDALARDKLEELQRTGGKAVSLAPNDGGRATFCQCPECKRLDPPEGRKIMLWDYTAATRRDFEYVSLTDRMVWFWNRLAERIVRQYPDARLGVYAYSAYEAPPVREKLHPNLAVGFVGVDYVRDANRRQGRADWEAWSKMTGNIFWRPNLLLFARRTGTPAVYVHKLAEDVRHFGRHGLVGTDFDSCLHHWATEGINYYVLARLLWDPEADVDALLDDYCRAGFGRAWPEVRRYLVRLEELTDRIAAEELTLTAPYTPEVVAELQGLLDAAQHKAEDDTVRRRVTFLRRGLELAALQHRAHAFLAQLVDRPPSADLKQAVGGVQQEKWLLMRRIFREDHLAVNVAMVAWGSEGLFGRLGWAGARSVPKTVVDADEKGRPADPPAGAKP